MSTVDCSRYQGVLSVPLLQGWKAAGVTRVILKAGGGDSGRYEDSKWAVNSVNVEAAGLILEGYWFNGTTDPAGDAQFLLTFIPTGIRVWADVESEGSMAHWSDDQADAFETTLIAAGHPTGTYMSSSVTFGSWPKCSRRPLWVAAYGGSSVPSVGNWRAPVLWQYTSTGHLPGYSGNLDLDQDLAGLASTTATPIPATPQPSTLLEDDMPYILSSPAGQTFISGDQAIGFATPAEVQTTSGSGVPTVAVSARMHNAIIGQLAEKSGLPIVVGVSGGDGTIYTLNGDKLVPLSSTQTVAGLLAKGAPQITITAAERDAYLGK